MPNRHVGFRTSTLSCSMKRPRPTPPRAGPLLQPRGAGCQEPFKSVFAYASQTQAYSDFSYDHDSRLQELLHRYNIPNSITTTLAGYH